MTPPLEPELGWRPVTPAGRPSVACVGETMVSLFPAHGGAIDAADTLALDTAGAESNVAMYLADHGVEARWVSRLGDDAFGRRIRRRLSASGVDVSAVRTDPTRPTGLLFKSPEDPSMNGGTRVFYYRRGSAASGMGPEALDEDAVRNAGLWHFTGITPALSPSCRGLIETALSAVDRPAISFDVNFRPAVWSEHFASGDPEESPARLLRRFAEAADVVFVGLDEAQELWGDGLRDPSDVRALIPTPRILVVKDGARAATAFFSSTHVSVPARSVAVVEPVGAGDAFAAGFLAGLLKGEPVTRCLRLGHVTAASALSVPGDHGPLPPKAELDRLLAASSEEWGL